MSENHDVQIAVLRTELDHVRKNLDEVREDLKSIKDTLQQARGGWKTLMLVGGLSSTLGALFAKFAPFSLMFPK